MEISILNKQKNNGHSYLPTLLASSVLFLIIYGHVYNIENELDRHSQVSKLIRPMAFAFFSS